MSRQDMLKLVGGPLVKKYTDTFGQKRCVGIKLNLKRSQSFGWD